MNIKPAQMDHIQNWSCVTFRQQIRPYVYRTTVKILIQQTGEAKDRTRDPWFTRRVAYSLHHSVPQFQL